MGGNDAIIFLLNKERNAMLFTQKPELKVCVNSHKAGIGGFWPFKIT